MEAAVTARICALERLGPGVDFRSGSDPDVCVFAGCEDPPDGRVDVGMLAGSSPVCLGHTIILHGPVRWEVVKEVREDGQTFVHVRGEL